MSVQNISAEFNGQKIWMHFDVPEDNLLERAAMNFLFHIIKQEEGHHYKGLRPKEINDRIVDFSVKKIEFLYDLKESFWQDFFQARHNTDLDALSVAVICQNYLLHINDHIGVSEDTIIIRDGGIDEDIVIRAQKITDEACAIMDGASAWNDKDISREGLFMAHLFAFGMLKDLEQDLDGYETEELFKLVNNKTSPVRNYSQGDTLIEQHLNKYLDIVEGDIHEKISRHLRSVAANGPHIHIIPPSTPTPL